MNRLSWNVRRQSLCGDIQSPASDPDIRRKAPDINDEMRNRFPLVLINMGINSGIAAVGMTRFPLRAAGNNSLTGVLPGCTLRNSIIQAFYPRDEEAAYGE